jgi:hypothetical protein
MARRARQWAALGRRDFRGGDEVQILGVSSGTIGPIHRTRQRDGAVDNHCLRVRDPRLIVDPDRHPRGGQGLDPAFAFARRGLVRDQPDINPAFLRADQCLDDPRAGCQAKGPDQDFVLGVVDRMDREGSTAKQTLMAAPEATDETGRVGVTC